MAFIQSVAQETYDNVLRLQHHPALMVWSGNNENEAAIAENWYGFSEKQEPIYAVCSMILQCADPHMWILVVCIEST